MRIFPLALFLIGCPTAPPAAVTPAPVVVKAPEVRGYAFHACAKPLRQVESVEFIYTTSQNNGERELSLRPMNDGVFCGQPEDKLAAGVPVTYYLVPNDMTLIREVGIAFPSPDYSDDEASPNGTQTVTDTDEEGRFVFLVVPERRGIKTIRMGTVRPGQPINGLFPPNEKPTEEPPLVPPPDPPPSVQPTPL